MKKERVQWSQVHSHKIRYYLKANGHCYEIVDPEKPYTFTHYAPADESRYIDPHIVTREVNTLSDVLEYLEIPPYRPITGRKRMRTLVQRSQMEQCIDPDAAVRLKVYRWLQSKKHVDSVEKHFHFSLEACAICQQFGKLIAGFLTF